MSVWFVYINMRRTTLKYTELCGGVYRASLRILATMYELVEYPSIHPIFSPLFLAVSRVEAGAYPICLQVAGGVNY